MSPTRSLAASHDRSSKRLPSLAALLAATLALAGCASQDKHVFQSTDHLPTTVTLVDTTNHQTVWSKAVPPRHSLEMDLDREGENEFFKVSGKPATSLRYELKNEKGDVVEEQTIELPGNNLLIKPVYGTGK